MCETNYIKNLFVSAGTTIKENQVQVAMKRSDGELFISLITLLTKDEADKVKKLLNFLEELRTCNCTRFSVCDNHSGLKKIEETV